MENQIQVFTNPLFGDIRTLKGANDELWFVGKDVVTALGYKDTVNALKVHVAFEDKAGWRITTQFGDKVATFINESGLYSLILSSKLPQAKLFKQWVTSEVLPQIRHTGGYIPVVEGDDDLTLLARAVLISQRTIELQKQQIQAQQQQIASDKPLVDFAHAVEGSGDTCTMAEMAKLLQANGINIGQNRFFHWMRQNHYVGTTKHHWNIAQQRWVEAGILQVETGGVWYDRHHQPHYSMKTVVTGKGQRYFIELFLASQAPLFSSPAQQGGDGELLQN